MSKSVYAGGGARRKNARENYLEQLSYGRGLSTYGDKKRKSFTHLHSFDDTDLAYRSASDYLRQSKQESPTIESLEMMLTRNIPRTKSASEMTPRNQPNRPASGNPRYKAQEDYYDDIQALKKELKSTKDENSNLRAKNRRLEEDNVRKRKEIDTLYDPTKDGDLRRTLTGSATDRNNASQIPTANVVISLKQRIFKLESQLKQKENKISEIEADPRWTRSTELEIQNRALMGEVERQKVERMNLIQNDYTASLEEEKKNAVKILEHEKRQLRDENKRLKEKIQEMENAPTGDRPSARLTNRDHDPELARKLDQLQGELQQAQSGRDQSRRELREMNATLEDTKRDRDEYRTKFNRTQEELDDLKRARDRQGPVNSTGRSSPGLKQDDVPLRNSRISSPVGGRKPQSPHGSTTALPAAKLNTSSGKLNESRSPNSSFTKSERPGSPRVFPSSKGFDTPAKSSARSLRGDSSNSDPKKNAKEHHAALVIQRSWRRHGKATKSPARDTNKLRHDNLDKWSSKVGSATKSTDGPSARSGSKDNLLGSGEIRSRPSSANASNEAAVKTIQASLRGLLNRNELEKPSSPAGQPRVSNVKDRPPQIESDEDDIVVSSPRSSRPGSEKTGSNSRNLSKPSSFDKLPLDSKRELPTDRSEPLARFAPNTRDSTARMQRPISPPFESVRSSSPKPAGLSSSKDKLPTDRNNLGSTNRFVKGDHESAITRPPSSSANPRSSGTSLKKENPRFSPEEPIRPTSGKSPSGSKVSLQKKTNDDTVDDDDDVEYK